MSNLYGVLCVASYCAFLVGASLAYRNQRSRMALLLMTLSVLAAVSVGLLSARPLLDFAAHSAIFLCGLWCCFFSAWIMYPLALICWSKNRQTLFPCTLVSIEFLWFVGIILLTYGYYKVPLA